MTKNMNETVDAEIVEEVINIPALKEGRSPVTYNEIERMINLYKDIEDIDPESEDAAEKYEIVKRGHIDISKARNRIEKERKSITDPAFQFQKDVKRVFDSLKAKLEPTETKLKAIRDKVENHEKMLIAQAEEAEMKRVNDIQDEIIRIRNIPLSIHSMSSSEIKELFDSLQAPTIEFFEEFLEKAVSVFKETSLHLSQSYETKIKAEQADELEAERKAQAEAEEADRKAKFEAEQAEFRKQQEEFQRQQEAQAEVIRKQQEAIDLQKAEAEAEKLMKQQEEERKERETKQEAERIEKEKAEKELAEKNRVERLALFEQRIEEAKADIEDSKKNIIDAIIDGEIRHIVWEG